MFILLVKHKNDPKKLWKTIKAQYKNEDSDIKRIRINDVVISEKEEIAKLMNEYYFQSVCEIVKEIPVTRNEYLSKIRTSENSFELKPLLINELFQIVKSMKNKSHVDNISGKVLCDAMKIKCFRDFLLNFVNKSLECDA